ncbi:MAG: Eisosome component PIL1-domain-containing protein [Linnemannia gamsii]|nr:MAG: Eisosome component PIL1-domain-containing protein [Linnemannia gamsii]
MQSIGHDLRRGLNNINPLGKDYKHINKWLAEMKNIDSSLKTLDKESTAEAKLIATWGSNEGDDLADVCLRMSQLMEEVGLIQQAYAIRHVAYRKTIKSIKTQEMTLDENRKKKHDLTTQLVKLQKSTKENPIKMMELQNGLERVTAELLSQELELMQFKRVTLKEAFDAKFDAMLEYSEKMALIAGYGRAITLVIDTETQVSDRMRIYTGAEYTAGAVNQVKTAVSQWQPQPMNSAPVARSQSVMSQDELALSAAATAYITKTPPKHHSFVSTQSPPHGYASGHDSADAGQGNLQAHASPDQEHSYVVPPQNITHAQQLGQIHDQQRQLELEQQRLYQQNLSSYSPERSPSQLHYQNAAGGSNGASSGVAGGYTPAMPRRSDTQELHPSPNNPSTSQGYGGYSQYDNATYASAAPARNYRLGFVDPRERSQMEMDNADTYKTEVNPHARPALPPLHFSQSPILHEK